ncbi:hypothetical protein JCGZ_18608 [Jatropha curcas]|uniref:Uncharacterized protein n=1 Tax=Jatropha curcas TaxID=180498 RepID=A0A067K1L8_JATCU|nr:hypothetical protein JCGZ_18608 [Jatropha curcas]
MIEGLDPPTSDAGGVSESANDVRGPLSPSSEPSRNRLREVVVLVPPSPSRSSEAMDVRAYFLKKYGQTAVFKMINRAERCLGIAYFLQM